MVTKKILHISYSKEFAGYGEAARTDLRALYESELDVVARAYELSPSVEDPIVEELGQKSLDGVTHVIQYLVPSHWERYPGVKNIGYLEIESNDLSHCIWADCLNLVDEIWVPNEAGRKTLRKITDLPIHIVPHAVDKSVYGKTYKPVTVKQAESDYFFYNISENVPRKNLAQLIACYYIEFDPTEPVSLMIKTSSNLDKMITSIQKRLKLYKDLKDYKQIAVIDQKLSADQIYGIHQSCHCYVNSSMGESWCLPLIDAIGFDNSIITVDEGGPHDIVKNIQSPRIFRINSVSMWCEGHTNFPGLQTGQDSWRMFDTNEMRKAMRSAYMGDKESPINNGLNRYCFENFVHRINELCF